MKRNVEEAWRALLFQLPPETTGEVLQLRGQETAALHRLTLLQQNKVIQSNAKGVVKMLFTAI